MTFIVTRITILIRIIKIQQQQRDNTVNGHGHSSESALVSCSKSLEAFTRQL